MTPIKTQLIQAFLTSRREPLGLTYARAFNRAFTDHFVRGAYSPSELAYELKDALRVVPGDEHSLFFEEVNPAAHALMAMGPWGLRSFMGAIRGLHEEKIN